MEQDLDSSKITLIAANCVPLVGVIFLGWDLFTILFLYWAESGVVGIFNVLKICKVKGWSGIFYSLFFWLHFGVFMVGHLLFLSALTAAGDGVVKVVPWEHVWEYCTIALTKSTFGILSLLVSHGISYYTNFILKKEYEKTTLNELFAAPYNRVMVMHFVIIVGGWFVFLLHSSNILLVLLVIIKIGIDIYHHTKTHTKNLPMAVNYSEKPNNNKNILIVAAIIFLLFIGIGKLYKFMAADVVPHTSNNSSNREAESQIQSYQVVETLDFPFLKPHTIALDSHNNIYVSESYHGSNTNARILKFNAEGKFLGWLGKGDRTTGWHDKSSTEKSEPGDGDGEFYYIFKIVFDNHDHMFVTDRWYYDEGGQEQAGNQRIQEFDENGVFLRWLGKGDKSIGWHGPESNEKSLVGTEEGALNQPTCLYLHGNDMLIGSWGSQKIDKFDIKTGELKEWFGKAVDGTYGWHAPGNGRPVEAPYFGTEIGAFNGPFDCKINSKNELYIVSYNSDPVLGIFDYDSGKFKWGLYHLKDGYKPQNIILDKYDNIIISDNYQGSIRFLTKNGNQTATMQLGPGGDYFGVGDFAMNSHGDLYFVEQQKQEVIKLKLKYN